MFETFLNTHTSDIILSPLSDVEINMTENSFEELIGDKLPEEYLSFLKESNGFAVNGLHIFGSYDEEYLKQFPRRKSYDIIRFNVRFRDLTDISDYIMLGKSSLDYVVYDSSAEKKYQILTSGTMDIIDEYDSFIELLTAYYAS